MQWHGRLGLPPASKGGGGLGSDRSEGGGGLGADRSGLCIGAPSMPGPASCRGRGRSSHGPRRGRGPASGPARGRCRGRGGQQPRRRNTCC